MEGTASTYRRTGYIRWINLVSQPKIHPRRDTAASAGNKTRHLHQCSRKSRVPIHPVARRQPQFVRTKRCYGKLVSLPLDAAWLNNKELSASISRLTIEFHNLSLCRLQRDAPEEPQIKHPKTERWGSNPTSNERAQHKNTLYVHGKDCSS